MTIEINMLWLYCYIYIGFALWVIVRFVSCFAPGPERKPFFSKDPDDLNEMIGFGIMAVFWPISVLLFCYFTFKIFKRQLRKRSS